MTILSDEDADRLACQALRQAAEVICQGNHCKNQYATDKYGNPVMTFDPRAVRFCITGSLMKAACRLVGTIQALQQVHGRACERVLAILPALGYHFPDISAWNDDPAVSCAEVAEVMVLASEENPGRGADRLLQTDQRGSGTGDSPD